MSAVLKIKASRERTKYDFEARLQRYGIDLPPLSVDTLQVNITKLCNQVCRHCHVDASPQRKEMLSPEGVARTGSGKSGAVDEPSGSRVRPPLTSPP